MTGFDWQPLDPSLAPRLVDARLQVHHAAQLAAAFGISYVPARKDDSHTNLEWIDGWNALASNVAHDTRVAIRVAQLELLVTDAEFNGRAALRLHGKTMDEAVAWLREQLAARGLDAATFALPKHYTIPEHAVGAGAAFDTSRGDEFRELERWYGNAAIALAALPEREHLGTKSPVRCWPHHFDIATLYELENGRTIGVGMEPGDQYYAEPYYYVNVHPSSLVRSPYPELAGNGHWHTHEWLGAVLPASALGTGDQHAQTMEFLWNAVATLSFVTVVLPAE